MATFAEEVAQARKAPSPPPAEAAPAPAEAPAPTPEIAKAPEAIAKDLSQFDLPIGKDPIVPPPEKPVEPVAAAPAEKSVEAVEAKKNPIKIGNREFEDINAAIEYAKELENASLADKAYIEGVKDATKKPAAEETPVETAYAKFSKDVFQDPEKAAKEFSETIKQELRDELNKSVIEQTAIAKQARARTDAWENFFKSNPDLSDPHTRDIVQNYIINKPDNWNKIKDLNPDKGFEKLAVMAREQLKITREAALPTKELASGPVTTTGASGADPVRPTQENSEKSMDFVAALNNLRAGNKKKK